MKPLLLAALLSLTFVPLPRVHAAADDKPAHQTLTPDEFEKRAKEPNTVILDVRTPKEYASGHLKDAVLIDFQAADFNQKVKELDKTKQYVVYCAVGIRGERACKKLDTLDFPKVFNLAGGIKAWEKAGKPTEK